MVPTEDLIAEPPLKKIKREHHETSIDSSPKSSLKTRGKNEEITLKMVLDEHNVFKDRHASYERIDAFFKDLVKCTENFSVKDTELFLHELTAILSQHSFKQYIKHNLGNYCQFLATILEKLTNLDSLVNFLHNETIFNKCLVLENDFQKSFLNIIFPKLIIKLNTYNDTKLFNETCEVFRKCIFNRSFTEFESYLNEFLNLSETKVDKNNSSRFIFKTLKSYRVETHGINLMYKIIFQSLCRSYNFIVVYKFLIISLELLGFDVSRDFECQKISKYIDTEAQLIKSLNVVSDILDVLKNNTTDLSCTVKEVNFAQFIENFLGSIFNLTKIPNEDCFKIIQFSIEIHPLLVEKNLNNLIIYSLRNTNCTDYADFLLKIFETYAKLHRIQNLVSKMLPILKNSIENRVEFDEYYTFRGNIENVLEQNCLFDNCLPENVLNFFTECVVQMASWQVMNLFKTFVYHLECTVTDFVNSNGESDNNFLQILCKFSSWLLRSMRMAENTIIESVRDKFKAGMNEFRNILSKLGEALLNLEHNEILVAAFLNLSHHWVELSIISNYYNKNESEETMNVHSFLSTDQWFNLTQRITNFGELNCKNLMLKLLVQKIRSNYLFENEIDENIQRDIFQHISSNLENDYKYLITERFLSENILEKLDTDTILNICEYILSTNEIPEQIKQSRIYSNAMIYTIFLKISKLFKKSKALFIKLFSSIDKKLFIEDNTCLETLKNIYETYEEKKEILKNNKITINLNLLKQLPIPYIQPRTQSAILLLLFSLHRNCNETELLEELITGILQVGKIDLIELFKPDSLVENITKNFEKKDVLITLLSENVMRNENSLKQFIPGVNYLLQNHKINNNLLNSIVILNELQKVIKSKPLKDLKNICAEIKESIINKHLEIITNETVDIQLIQSFVACLKYNSSENLINLTEDYLNVVLSSKKATIPKGCISFFSIVLHNKQILSSQSNLPLKIWEFSKDKEVLHEDTRVFSQVLCLVFEHIPNEDFERVAVDLCGTTVEKLGNEDFPEVSKYLERWSNIVKSSFNPIKSKKLSEILEKLLFKLSIFKDKVDFNQEVFDEIMRFELVIIQQYQLHLTPAIMGILLMSPIILLRKNAEISYKFYKSIEHLEQLLKHRSSLIMDRLPPYLKIFRFLLENLCENCTNDQLNNLDDCAHQLEKFIKHLVKHNVHISRIAPHLIADILQQYEKSTLNPKIKVHLNNCIYSLIPLCDHHAVSYLLRVLSTASRELFKIMYDNYKKFYRFTGKV